MFRSAYQSLGCWVLTLVLALVISPPASAGIPDTAVMYVDVRVQPLVQSLHDALLPMEVAEVLAEERFGVGISEIDRVRVIAGVDETGSQPLVGASIDFKGDVKLSERLQGKEFPLRIETDENGRELIRLPPFLVMVQVTPRRVLLSSTIETIDLLMAPETSAGPLETMMAKLPRGEFAIQVAVAVEPIRPIVMPQVKSQNVSPEFADLKEIPEWIDGILITVATPREKPVAGQIKVVGRDEASAASLEAMVAKYREMARTTFQEWVAKYTNPANLSEESKTALRTYLLRLSDTVFKTLEPQRTGEELVVNLKSGAGLAAFGSVFGLLMPLAQGAQESGRRTYVVDNLRQIAVAMHNYHDVHQHFPARYTVDEAGKPLLSWRVALLPYLGHTELYEQFRLDEPWDSDHNRPLIDQMPEVYRNPGFGDANKSPYQAPVVEGGMWKEDQPRPMREITDGTSNTVMLVETAFNEAVVWTQPADYEIDADQPLGTLPITLVHGFHAALADGSVRLIEDSIDVDLWRALLTCSGGERVDF